MCIDIVEIYFGIADWQISSIFDKISAHDMIMAGNIVSHFIYFCIT